MEHFLNLIESTAKQHMDSEILSNYQDSSYTYKDVFDRIAKIHLLFHNMNIEKGDHISICSRNSAEWAITFLAITTYHAVAVPILYDFKPEDVEKLVEHSDSVILFTESTILNEIDPCKISKLKAVIETDTSNILFSKEKYEHKNCANTKIFDNQYNINELVVINYTSGTTGNPKGVMLTAENISSNIAFGLKRIPVRYGDTIVSMLPMAHMYGLAFEFLYPLAGGAHVYFLGKTPSPKILLKALGEVRPYILITVPLVLEKIFKANIIPALNKPLLKIAKHIPLISSAIYLNIRNRLLTMLGGNIRTIVVGGAAMSKPIEKVIRKVRLPYTIGYGMTECGPLLAYEDWREFRPTSCGKAVTGMKLRIDSYDPINIPGEIQAKGVNVTSGYYKNSEATENAFTKDGWLKTGDLGIIDYAGNVIIKGRSKCMILSSSGQNIYPEEIEDKLNNLNWISESIVVERNRSLVAIIALKDEFKNYKRLYELTNLIKREINRILPNYSQISKVEIRDRFEHTPKHSIKRFLYS